MTDKERIEQLKNEIAILKQRHGIDGTNQSEVERLEIRNSILQAENNQLRRELRKIKSGSGPLRITRKRTNTKEINLKEYKKLVDEGITDTKIAEILNVSKTKLYEWKTKHGLINKRRGRPRKEIKQ